MMRGLVCLALATAILPAAGMAQTEAVAAAAAPDAGRYALAKEVVALIMPEDQREAMMRAMMTGVMANMRDGIRQMLAGQKLNDAQRSVIARFIDEQNKLSQDQAIAALPALLDAMAKAYARQFSTTELNDLKAFFTSASGQAYIRKSPTMMADPDIAAVQRQMMESSMKRLPADMTKMVEELKQAASADKK